MPGDAAPKMFPLSESGNWPGKRQEKGKGVPVRGTGNRTQPDKFKRLQAALAGASVPGGMMGIGPHHPWEDFKVSCSSLTHTQERIHCSPPDPSCLGNGTSHSSLLPTF